MDDDGGVDDSKPSGTENDDDPLGEKHINYGDSGVE
jgi:hypothetical protein